MILKRHKEERNDEIFVGNSSIEHMEELFLDGIDCRLGCVAYDIHDKIIKNDGIKPLFIKKTSFKRYDNKMRKECGFIF